MLRTNPKQVWAQRVGFGAAGCKGTEAAWLQGAHRGTSCSAGLHSSVSPSVDVPGQGGAALNTQPVSAGDPKTKALRPSTPQLCDFLGVVTSSLLESADTTERLCRSSKNTDVDLCKCKGVAGSRSFVLPEQGNREGDSGKAYESLCWQNSLWRLNASWPASPKRLFKI